MRDWPGSCQRIGHERTDKTRHRDATGAVFEPGEIGRARVDTSTILLKSPRGHEEIRTRAHGLAPLARRLLIMADGRHTVMDLAAELGCEAHDGELQEALRELLDGKYLHVWDEYDDRKWPPQDFPSPQAST